MELLATVITSIVTAVVTPAAAFLVQERRLRRDSELDRDKLRTEFMAERVARQLLEVEKLHRLPLDPPPPPSWHRSGEARRTRLCAVCS